MKAYERLHPAVGGVFFLSLLIITMFLSHPVIHAVSLAGGLIFQRIIQRRKSFYKSLAVYLVILVTVTITNPIISQLGATVLFRIFGLKYTLQALLYGVDMGIMLVAVSSWCVNMSKVLTAEKITYLFAKRLPKTAMLISMTIRYIPLLRRRWTEVYRAQRSSGEFAGKTAIGRISAYLHAFSILIGWSLECAVESSRSMRARGYGGGKRTSFSVYRFKAGDSVFLAVLFLLFALTVAGSICGYTLISFYPTISAIDFRPQALITYAGFALMSLMPAIMETKEVLSWKYYLSRT